MPESKTTILQILGKFPSGDSELPSVNENDDGKILIVSGGKWSAGELPKYNGEYSVTPQVDSAQTFETAGKYLSEDITVKAIPDYEVSNEAGGNTFIIGKEI